MPEIEETEVRSNILDLFRKHCMGCTGSCCDVELEGEFMAFDWEVARLPEGGKGLVVLEGGTGKGCVKHVSFEGGRCPFSGSKICKLSLKHDRSTA